MKVIIQSTTSSNGDFRQHHDPDGIRIAVAPRPRADRRSRLRFQPRRRGKSHADPVPSGFALNRTFDPLNRPSAIDWAANASSSYSHPVSYGYRGTGLITSKTLSNGLTGTHQYDAVRRPLDETFQAATSQAVFHESQEESRYEDKRAMKPLHNLGPGEMEISKAWLAGAQALGFEVVAPYELSWNGALYLYPVHLLHFGGSTGALLVALTSLGDDRVLIAKEAGFFCSKVDVEGYGYYDAETFKDMLNDLGWFGPPKEAPNWYTGEPWA